MTSSPLRFRGPRSGVRVPRPDDPRARRGEDARMAGFLDESEDVGFDDDGRLYIKPDSPTIKALEERIAELEAAVAAAGMVT